MADSQSIPSDISQSPADSGSDYTVSQPTISTDSPVTTESANISNPTDSSPSGKEDSVTSGDTPQSVIPADSKDAAPSKSPADSNQVTPVSTPDSALPISPQSPHEATPSPQATETTPEQPSEPSSGDSIQDLSSSNQPSQGQSEAPSSTPGLSASIAPESQPQSAVIKPEPVQLSQNTPSADSGSIASPPTEISAKAETEAGAQDTSASPKSSFGDIMYGIGKPSPTIQQTSPSPIPASPVPQVSATSPTTAKASFGDLIGEKPIVEPTINIEPVNIPNPPPSVSTPLPQTPQSDQSASRRQKSAVVRKQKHEDNISKTLVFIVHKGKVNNQDIRDFLHISQTTATEYLHILVTSGKIKKEGKGKSTKYSSI